MLNRYLWARGLVKQLESKWGEHKYNVFLNKATLSNFLDSQAGLHELYKAVPNMYLRIMQYANDDAKYDLLQLMYKEMGSGKKDKGQFELYLKFMNAFDYKVDNYSKINPFVKKYISGFLFEKTQSWVEMISYLAGMQYTLSFFKQKIADYLYANKWINSQDFYKLSEDYTTGEALLYIVENEDEIDKDIFINAQTELFYLLEKLIVITNEDLKYIHSNRINSFITREDSNVELKVFNSINKSELDIFSICSGGEHIIKYLQQTDKISHIDVCDINNEQLDVLKHKLKYIQDKNTTKLNNYLQTKGKVEELMEWFNFYDMNKYSIESIKFACERVCTLDIYQEVFGFSLKTTDPVSFNHHFIDALKRGAFEHSKYITDIRYRENSFEYLNELNSKSTIQYICQNILNIELNKTYDIIDLSNVGDSLDEAEYFSLLTQMKKHLSDEGSLIVRKLVSYVELYPLLKKVGFTRLIEHDDETYLYTNTIEAKK